MPDLDSLTRSKPSARAWSKNFDVEDNALLPEPEDLDGLPDDFGTDYGESDQTPDVDG